MTMVSLRRSWKKSQTIPTENRWLTKNAPRTVPNYDRGVEKKNWPNRIIPRKSSFSHDPKRRRRGCVDWWTLVKVLAQANQLTGAPWGKFKSLKLFELCVRAKKEEVHRSKVAQGKEKGWQHTTWNKKEKKKGSRFLIPLLINQTNTRKRVAY